MRGLGIAFLFAAVVLGSLVLWARSLGKEVHAIASLPPATVLYPNAVEGPRPLIREHCHPDVPGWYMSFRLVNTPRHDVEEWYDMRFGPRDPELSTDGRVVYDDIAVWYGRPWESNPVVQVFAYNTTTHTCPPRRAELWDIGPNSTYEHAGWVRVHDTAYAPAPKGERETLPEGWTVLLMRLVDARVATHPDEENTIWVRRGDGPWQEYGTEFVYWEM